MNVKMDMLPMLMEQDVMNACQHVQSVLKLTLPSVSNVDRHSFYRIINVLTAHKAVRHVKIKLSVKLVLTDIQLKGVPKGVG